MDILVGGSNPSVRASFVRSFFSFLLLFFPTNLNEWAAFWRAITDSFIIDTHQFFLHKAMHEVPYLYRNFHSHHHRLYVPYAFGALYNHWLEGLLLDSVGAAMAEWLSGMTVRQTILLFGFSSAKTVDDHSGYRIWWDPMQVCFFCRLLPSFPLLLNRWLCFFGNNSSFCLRTMQTTMTFTTSLSVSRKTFRSFCMLSCVENDNLTPQPLLAFPLLRWFRQPFFTRWDHIFNTVMTREEVLSRKIAKGMTAEQEIGEVEKQYKLE